MSTRADSLAALRHSQTALVDAVDELSVDDLTRGSFCSEWSVAQVVSHLGSQAEIFGAFLDAGLTGSAALSQDDFPAIWRRWDDRSPEEQVVDGLAVNEELITRLEGSQ